MAAVPWWALSGLVARRLQDEGKPAGRHRYHRPAALDADPALREHYTTTLDRAFDTYAALIPKLVEHFEPLVPDEPGTPAPARARAIRARALDALRGLLPAATEANLGIFASGQAYESLLIRLQSHALPEARECGTAMLRELRKVIPAFLTRVDREDRGVRHGAYLADADRATTQLATELLGTPAEHADGPIVRLVDWDRDGETRVVAHALWPSSGRSFADVRGAAEAMNSQELLAVMSAYEGARSDRRHRPGRALEATSYTFEVVCDYGAYRDLQRHRLLTLQAQPLTPHLGYDVPAEVTDAGLDGIYAESQAACAGLYALLAPVFATEASYAVTLAHRIRFTLTLNAREAMHLIELRSQPQGHETYRVVAQEMHRLIEDEAGHRALAEMMRFVDRSSQTAGRLAAERRQEQRAAQRAHDRLES